MTISNTTTKATYTGNGSNRRWDIPFPYTDNSELNILVTDDNGTETAVVSAYEVDSSKTFLTYPTVASELDPLPSTHKLSIVRQTPLTQENDLIQQATLNKESLEASLDKLTRMVQENAEQCGRAIKTKVSGGAPSSAEDYFNAIQTATTTATNAASTASSYASAAASSASTASSAASTASSQASLASGYATAAAGSASTAELHKDAAAGSATAAQGYKEDAVDAKTAAQSAKADAESAAADALSAKTDAVSAKNDAVSAKNDAVSAKTDAVSANTAAQAAATTAQSAASALTSHNTSNTAHADIRLLIAGKQDTLEAGDGIQINGNVISAPGGGGGGGSDTVAWGNITGTLSNQTDLKNALDGKQEAGSYAAASHTHTKSQITDFPTIPSKVSDLTNDSGFITDIAIATTSAAGKVKPDGSTITVANDGTIAVASHTHTKSQITDFPTIPAKLSDLTDDLGSSPTHTHSQYLTSVPTATTSAKGGVKPDGSTITVANDGTIAVASHTHTKSQITDFPTIPTVPTNLSSFTDDLGNSPTHTHSQYLTSVPAASSSTLGGVKLSYDSTTETLTISNS